MRWCARWAGRKPSGRRGSTAKTARMACARSDLGVWDGDDEWGAGEESDVRAGVADPCEISGPLAGIVDAARVAVEAADDDDGGYGTLEAGSSGS